MYALVGRAICNDSINNATGMDKSRTNTNWLGKRGAFKSAQNGIRIFVVSSNFVSLTIRLFEHGPQIMCRSDRQKGRTLSLGDLGTLVVICWLGKCDDISLSLHNEDKRLRHVNLITSKLSRGGQATPQFHYRRCFQREREELIGPVGFLFPGGLPDAPPKCKKGSHRIRRPKVGSGFPCSRQATPLPLPQNGTTFFECTLVTRSQQTSRGYIV